LFSITLDLPFVKGFLKFILKKLATRGKSVQLFMLIPKYRMFPAVWITRIVSLVECLLPLDIISITRYLAFDKMAYCTKLFILQYIIGFLPVVELYVLFFKI
jgi:hypothetical protein